MNIERLSEIDMLKACEYIYICKCKTIIVNIIKRSINFTVISNLLLVLLVVLSTCRIVQSISNDLKGSLNGVNSISLLLGKGDGTFHIRTIHEVGHNPASITFTKQVNFEAINNPSFQL